jgi:hypothetical protein
MQLQYPTGEGEETAVEFAIDPEKFHDAFAADLPAEQTAVMAATQRPVEPGEPVGSRMVRRSRRVRERAQLTTMVLFGAALLLFLVFAGVNLRELA